jgi:hypothetical protein
MFRNMLSITVFAGTIALCLGSVVAGASGESPSLTEGQARFEPIQAITYEFGSKLTTGYFVEQDGTCIVTLMVTEKGDPENPLGLSPTRVRLTLSPGQIAGFDSEEGRSLNFTCEGGAATLLVDIGERDKLVAAQEAALHPNIAQQQ